MISALVRLNLVWICITENVCIYTGGCNQRLLSWVVIWGWICALSWEFENSSPSVYKCCADVLRQIFSSHHFLSLAFEENINIARQQRVSNLCSNDSRHSQSLWGERCDLIWTIWYPRVSAELTLPLFTPHMHTAILNSKITLFLPSSHLQTADGGFLGKI